jgi:hypothetical protein
MKNKLINELTDSQYDFIKDILNNQLKINQDNEIFS